MRNGAVVKGMQPIGILPKGISAQQSQSLDRKQSSQEQVPTKEVG